MKQEQFGKYNKAAEDGTIPDEENPISLFATTPNKLLVMGLNKEFSFSDLAKRTLANRGFNLQGEWVGFDKAAENLKRQKPPKKGQRP